MQAVVLIAVFISVAGLLVGLYALVNRRELAMHSAARSRLIPDADLPPAAMILREEESALEQVLVCGDFNVAPNDEDVHDPALWRGAIMCSEEERGAFRAVCVVGLADTLRLHHPEPGIFSWWDYRMLSFPKNRGLRIDAVLAGSELAANCRDAGVDREMRKGKEPSDHAPVWAEFGS
jgi:exodeoxyribonuclease III